MNSKTKHWVGIFAGILSLAGYASAASLGSEKYTYDASGNIVEKSIDGQVTKMSYDASNKVTSIASSANDSEQISYDAAGRPVSYKDASGQSTREISYGYGYKVLNADSVGDKGEFFYNAEGQLVGKSVAGKLTSYSWDGNVIAAEGKETFTNEAHITGGIPAMTGDQSVVVSDYLGNTLSQGMNHFSSSAYGGGLELGRFTGKLFVKELNAFVFQHRLYQTESASWNLNDPSGFPDGANSYSYAICDPVSNVDPLGLRTKVAKYSMVVGTVTDLNFNYKKIDQYGEKEYTGTAVGTIVEEGGAVQLANGGTCSISQSNTVNCSWTATAGLSATLWDTVTASVTGGGGGGTTTGTTVVQTWTHPGDGKHYDVYAAKRKITHTVTFMKNSEDVGTIFTNIQPCVPPKGPFTDNKRETFNAVGMNVYEL